MIKAFDHRIVLNACGLINNSSMCYLNSMLQSLMSCTAVTAHFTTHTRRYIRERNTVAIEYCRLLNDASADVKQTLSPDAILKAIVDVTKKRCPNKQFGAGQEDAGEGLHLFLNAIDDPLLYRLFMHKYRIRTICKTCKTKLLDTRSESCVLEIPMLFDDMIIGVQQNVDPINSYVQQFVSVLDDYTCKKCKTQNCCRVYQLMHIPEIMIIMFNKFQTKKLIMYPQQLYIPGIKSKHIHTLIAKIDHFGRHSGHYIAHCHRRGNTKPLIAMLNDSIVSVGTLKPSTNTYLLFYHKS